VSCSGGQVCEGHPHELAGPFQMRSTESESGRGQGPALGRRTRPGRPALSLHPPAPSPNASQFLVWTMRPPTASPMTANPLLCSSKVLLERRSIRKSRFRCPIHPSTGPTSPLSIFACVDLTKRAATTVTAAAASVVQCQADVDCVRLNVDSPFWRGCDTAALAGNDATRNAVAAKTAEVPRYATHTKKEAVTFSALWKTVQVQMPWERHSNAPSASAFTRMLLPATNCPRNPAARSERQLSPSSSVRWMPIARGSISQHHAGIRAGTTMREIKLPVTRFPRRQRPWPPSAIGSTDRAALCWRAAARLHQQPPRSTATAANACSGRGKPGG